MPSKWRHAACPAHERQIGVVHRLEQYHLVAGLDERHERAGDRLGRAGGDHHLGLGIEREAVPVAVMRGDGLTQLRQAHHGRVLVPALDHPLGGLAPHVLGAGVVRKALAEIDRAGLPCQPRHHLEDARLEIGEDGIHGRLSGGGPARSGAG
jgi:hypothetical protein